MCFKIFVDLSLTKNEAKVAPNSKRKCYFINCKVIITFIHTFFCREVLAVKLSHFKHVHLHVHKSILYKMLAE